MVEESTRASSRGPLRLAVWADGEATPTLRQIAGHPQVEIAVVGADDRIAAKQLSETLSSRTSSDPREALAASDVDALLLLAPDVMANSVLKSVLDLSKPVLAERPMPARVEEWADFESSPHRPVPVPRISASRHWFAGAEWVEAIGPVEAMQISLRCHPSEGSLIGRLADGIDLLLTQMGMPAQIAAFGPALCDPPDAHLREAVPPVTMTAAYADGRWATVALAIGPHRWHRGVDLLGPDGTVRWNDCDIEWLGPDGVARGGGTGLPVVDDRETTSPGAVLGEFLHRWWMRQDGPADPPLPHRELLACLEATRLAARTGCLEDPGGLLSLL